MLAFAQMVHIACCLGPRITENTFWCHFKDKYTAVSKLAYLLLKSAWPPIQFWVLESYYFQTVVY